MVDEVIIFFASILIWVMFAGLLFVWLIDGRVKKEIALHSMFAALFSWGVAKMLKDFIPTTRPYLLNGTIPMTLIPPSDSAFPSIHAAVAFAIAISLWLHDKVLGTAFIATALVIGIARIVSNVHYPLDILGGAVIGAGVALAVDRLHVYKLVRKLRN